MTWSWGLSPRVRGNPDDAGGGDGQHRSIPACTGEPPLAAPRRAGQAVYPRVYGGTAVLGADRSAYLGLSPRVRGNRQGSNAMALYSRSIPACTGEPKTEPAPNCRATVYPRVYGGTGKVVKPSFLLSGLSPPCTGEPRLSSWLLLLVTVYPRVYGGTAAALSGTQVQGGLSPRVRGNPITTGLRPLRQRSIPACTGEPPATALPFDRPGVYPRVYGGTGVERGRSPATRGLSPRVRGNRSRAR